MQILAHPANMHATIALLPKPFHTSLLYEVTSYVNIVPVQYIHCMVFSHVVDGGLDANITIQSLS